MMTSLPLAPVLTCFPMFVYIHARFLFALIGGNLTAQRIPSIDVVASSPSFSGPAAIVPLRACSQVLLQTSLDDCHQHALIRLLTRLSFSVLKFRPEIYSNQIIFYSDERCIFIHS